MRGKLFEAHGTPEGPEVKRGPGRMMEVELLAQTMALLAGSDLRGTKDQLCVSDSGLYIAQDTATKIGENYDWFWSVQSGLRLLTVPGVVPANSLRPD